MAKVKKNEKLIEEVVDRGVENIYPNKKLLIKELNSGRPLRLYCGYDPSAPALHIGNTISLIKMAQLQKLGHEVIFLIGSFTGMIGDPSGKKAVRQQLTREEVLKNSKNYQQQAAKYLDFGGDNPAKLLYNSDWSDKLTFADLIDIASNFTVQQMIQRDMFQARLKEDKPIHLHEFLYPLAQAYDSLHLAVDLEVGGNDQMFNMMSGRDLIKSVTGKEKFVLTMKLLIDDQGEKMGKSEGNAVFLDNKAEDMYGKIMSWSDSLIINGFELCTQVDLAEIKEMKNSLIKDQVNPRDLKMKLAWEIVKINHGEKLAKLAEEQFIETIQKKELPKQIKEVKIIEKELILDDLLIKLGLVVSKSEARRLVEQGAIKAIVSDQAMIIFKNPKELIKLRLGMIIQRGKRQFVKIKQ